MKKQKPSFADILDKWERGTTGDIDAGVSANNALSEWLQNNQIYDKDAEAEKTLPHRKNRKRLLNNRPDDILDIHGLTREKAWISLDVFFTKAKDNNYEKLRIIHGKGNHSQSESILRSTVQKYIEKCPFAGESGYEKSINGGTGATWVLLKQVIR